MAQMAGKVAIVTGGGSGMGRATSLLFAREGAEVVVADINDAGGQQTVAMIGQTGGRATFVHTDTADEAAIIALVRSAATTYGRVDAMVTAAGISYSNFIEKDEATDPFRHPEAGFILNKPTARWQKVLDVNLTGVMSLCARSRSPDDRRRAWWDDRQFRVDRGVWAGPDDRGLLRVEGWCGDAHEMPGGRSGALRHPGERGGARPHRNRYDPVAD
ncbi:MAG: SDR family NAD(P)-dependent oxidoreductase [Gammaproteobacteria bacterium]|nr:SDR family NAD(P)-dependent oxidoreductase [Gammaproteobacteria bacterium]